MVDRVSDAELWKVFADELAKPALALLGGSHKRDDASLLLRQFLNEVMNSASVIAHLSMNYKGEWGVEAAVLLRRAYDISFQARYLIKDFADTLERAKDHEDHIWIERVRSISDMDRAALEGAAIARGITKSPKRIVSEVEIRARYERAINRQKARHGKKRRNWYGNDLRELACQCGMLPEYLITVRDLHAITHNAPSVRDGAVMSNQRHLLVWIIDVVERVLKCNLDYHGLSLGAELDDHLKRSLEDMYMRENSG